MKMLEFSVGADRLQRLGLAATVTGSILAGLVAGHSGAGVAVSAGDPTVGAKRSWAMPPVYDQGPTANCVGYATIGWLQSVTASPLTGQTTLQLSDQGAAELAADLVGGAKEYDQWKGSNYGGTSIQGEMTFLGTTAGSQFLPGASTRLSVEYTRNVRVAAEYVLEHGPIIVDGEWYDGDYSPDPATGYARATGRGLGGHAFLCTAYEGTNAPDNDDGGHDDSFFCTNSYGTDYGQHGRFWLHTSDLQKMVDGYGYGAIVMPTLSGR